jgi:hypothetical protein
VVDAEGADHDASSGRICDPRHEPPDAGTLQPPHHLGGTSAARCRGGEGPGYQKGAWRDGAQRPDQAGAQRAIAVKIGYVPVKRRDVEPASQRLDCFDEVTFKSSGSPVATFDRSLRLPAAGTVRFQIEFTPLVVADNEISYRLTDRAAGQTFRHQELLGVFVPDVTLLRQSLAAKIEDVVKVRYAPPRISRTRRSAGCSATGCR